MSEFTVMLLFLAIPGIICLFLRYKLIGKSNRSNIEIIFEVFLYSVFSYLIVDLSVFILNLFPCIEFDFPAIDMLLNLNNKKDVDPSLLLYASLASIFLAFVLSYAIRYNIVNIIGQFIRATKRYGDEDVWHFFHNAPESQKNDGWVIVRDLKQGLSYHCYISIWSDSGMDREVVLSDVSVFNNDTSEFLYELQHLYLCRNKDDIIIEIPPLNPEIKDEWKLENNIKKEEN